MQQQGGTQALPVCRGLHRAEVDWWVMLKHPGGYQYSYVDSVSSSDAGGSCAAGLCWRHGLSMQNPNPVSHTLEVLTSPAATAAAADSLAYAIYNDADPAGTEHFDFAHAKVSSCGVWVAKAASIWLCQGFGHTVWWGRHCFCSRRVGRDPVGSFLAACAHTGTTSACVQQSLQRLTSMTWPAGHPHHDSTCFLDYGGVHPVQNETHPQPAVCCLCCCCCRVLLLSQTQHRVPAAAVSALLLQEGFGWVTAHLASLASLGSNLTGCSCSTPSLYLDSTSAAAAWPTAAASQPWQMSCWQQVRLCTAATSPRTWQACTQAGGVCCLVPLTRGLPQSMQA